MIWRRDGELVERLQRPWHHCASQEHATDLDGSDGNCRELPDQLPVHGAHIADCSTPGNAEKLGAAPGTRQFPSNPFRSVSALFIASTAADWRESA